MDDRKPIPIDLDETLCKCDYELCPACNRWEYKNPTPIQEEIDRAIELIERGLFVIIYTARPWDDYGVTRKQLDDLGLQGALLVCGKVPGKPVDADALRSLSELDC
jgi:hypothetical protein